MPKVRFEPAGFETDVEPGTRLVDVTDDHPEAEVPFSCRSASCGTCRVEVVEGSGALAPAEEEEQEVIEIFGDPPEVRLCCQLYVDGEGEDGGEGRVVLRVVEP